MRKRECFDALFISGQRMSPEGITIHLQQLAKYHGLENIFLQNLLVLLISPLSYLIIKWNLSFVSRK